MGNKNPKIIFNKYISFIVKTEKVCYFPGEYIKGKLILEGKPGLKDTLLKDPKAIITIIQKEQYRYNNGEGYSYENLNTIIYKKNIFFNTFIGANLLTKIEISFAAQVPSFAHPTCIFNIYDYVKHYFSIEFPSLKIKITLTLVVKHYQNFTKKNKLLKIPCHCTGKETKKNSL